MTKTAVAPDERDEKIARLEKQVGDLVDAIVKLAGERPIYLPCQMPHFPQPYYPGWPQITYWPNTAGAQPFYTGHGITYAGNAAGAPTTFNAVIDATGANTLIG